MQINYSLVFLTVLPSVLLAILLFNMAGRRGLDRWPWALLGLIPLLNLLGLISLMKKPKTNTDPVA